MPLTKIQKQKIIENLKEKIAKQKIIIFTDFTGLKAKDISLLRKRLKGVDGELRVAKKTLIGIAFKNKGLAIETKKLPGEIALVFGYKDEISLAKAIWQFSQENPNLKILAGLFENKLKSGQELITLAQLPAREELLRELFIKFLAPLSNFLNLLEANIKGLILILANKTKI